MNLKDLSALVAGRWPFDSATYPELREEAALGRKLFAIRHVLLHIQKSAGKLAAACERAEHGGGDCLDFEELGDIARKSLVNALRLADVVGVTPEELVLRVQRWAEEKGGSA